MKNKVWFITGVSSGFGRVLVEELVRRGACVAGTLRKREQVDAFNKEFNGKALGVFADVTRSEEVQSAVDAALKKFGRIDVLVNNAGYGILGAIEEISLHEAKHQMETNFFGALRVTQAVLPHMRRQKSGHILQISSAAGFKASPGLGLYNASKFALEGMSEALAFEVKSFGIRVTIVEPGPFRTKFADSSLDRAHVRIPEYQESAGLTEQRILSYNGKQDGDPVKGVLAMIQAVESADPPLRLPLGKFTLDAIQVKIESVQKDIAAWKKTALSTDDPISR